MRSIANGTRVINESHRTGSTESFFMNQSDKSTMSLFGLVKYTAVAFEDLQSFPVN